MVNCLFEEGDNATDSSFPFCIVLACSSLFTVKRRGVVLCYAMLL